MKLLILLWCVSSSLAYFPTGKENYFSHYILRELANKLSKNSNSGGVDVPAYFDLGDSSVQSLGSRSLEEEQYFPLDYELEDSALLHPSIRDQELLQHSSLWGSQYMSGGAGEGKQMLAPDVVMMDRQQVKTDGALPAYCSPPNPCPVGYEESEGCIKDFENTAAFSRGFQGMQDCMCDSEHMFDCPRGSFDYGRQTLQTFNDLDFNQFINQHFKDGHKNLVAKKFHTSPAGADKRNPFLTGERLPVAAKKGNRIY